MEMTVATRLKHAWNTFMNRDSYVSRMSIGPSYGYRPDRPLFSRGNERSIITSVYNRIALDVSSMTVQHVRLDGSDRFKEVIESGLNNCLTVEANVDQTGRAFMGPVQLSKWSHSGSFVPQHCGDDRDERDRAGRGDVRTGSGLPQIHCAKQ